jgi:hypothetical protein
VLQTGPFRPRRFKSVRARGEAPIEGSKSFQQTAPNLLASLDQRMRDEATCEAVGYVAAVKLIKA